MNEIFHKIVFELTPGEDGYPPVSAESIWGIYAGDGTHILDNTPYYVYGVSKGDSVQVKSSGDEMIAVRVAKQGGHSTVRVFASDTEERSKIIAHLHQLGASCSVSQEMSLFAVDIPSDCDFSRSTDICLILLMGKILHMRMLVCSTHILNHLVWGVPVIGFFATTSSLIE